MTIRVQPLTEPQIRAFITWTYDGPYAVYNLSGGSPEESVAFFSDPANGYFAIVDDNSPERDALLGFCNVGADARVQGGAYDEEAIDIGIGMRPDLTGRGLGATYAAMVFDFAGERYPGRVQRVTIAAFNQRAQHLCRKFGFCVVDRFADARNGRPFLIMTRVVGEGR